MLQVVQYQKTGKLSVEQLPSPQVKHGHILVRNICSLVSAGTERTSVETAQASLIGKAKSRPDLVKQVMDNVKREGLIETYAKVQNRLDNYKELGYSSAGVVVESGVDDFKVGDRVACAGSAYHAEMVLIPKHLAVRLPEGMEFSEGAFTTLGAIALQGVRQADVRIGENVAVIGLGLVGLLTVQILKANGCRVIGLDISDLNFTLARQLGCDVCLKSDRDAINAIATFTGGYGTDAVLITASTNSNEPIELAFQFARRRSRVVVIGAVGMDIPRPPFYEKEVELRISSSYGPGRHDPAYETDGVDYPIGFVRWTENRNMEAVVQLIAEKKLSVLPLVTHRFPISDALKAYNVITGEAKERNVAVLIEYPEAQTSQPVKRISLVAPRQSSRGEVVAGFIGAGNFAQSYLLPVLKDAKVRLKGVATGTPIHAKSVAGKFGFEFLATDAEEILRDDEINAVFIATRHDSHARFVQEALQRGKHVYVEKPLAISTAELDDVLNVRKEHSESVLLVGYNRRFSRVFRDMSSFMAEVQSPFTVLYRVNAGTLPKGHWASDPRQGGRIIGEACHFIDTMSFLVNSRPVSVFAQSADAKKIEDVAVTITFANGSIGTLLYLTGGDASVPKEYCEIHGGGKSVMMDNFTTASFHSGSKSSRKKYDGSKGHKEEMLHFLDLIRDTTVEEISFESMYDTTRVTFLIPESRNAAKALVL